MICHKCNNPGVLSSALGKTFYYCRTCKEEIGLDTPTSEDPVDILFEPLRFWPATTPRKFRIGDKVKCIDPQKANNKSHHTMFALVQGGHYEVTNVGWRGLDVTDGLIVWSHVDQDAFELVPSYPPTSPNTSFSNITPLAAATYLISYGNYEEWLEQKEWD